MAARTKHSPNPDLRLHPASFGPPLVAATLCALGAAAPATADVRFNPRITVSGTYSDNITVAPDELKESEYVAQVNPGFRLEAESPRFDAYADYDMQNLFFAEESDRDSTYHEFDGRALAQLAGDVLFLDAAATYSQRLIDPEQEIPYSNLVVTDNRADAFTFRVNPYWNQPLGDWALLRVGYAFGQLNYTDEDDSIQTDDSELQEFRFAVESRPEDALIGWLVGYDRDHISYEIAPDAIFETARAGLEYRATDTFTLLANGGLETDPLTDLENGNLDEEFYEGGVRLTPGPRTLIEAAVGHRFFGTSYRFLARYDGPALELQASYDESPDTDAQEQLQVPFQAEVPFQVEPDPPVGTGPILRATPDVFLAERFNARLRWNRSRTEFGVDAFYETRDYVTDQPDDENAGINTEFRWRFGVRTTLRISADFERVVFEVDEREDDFFIGGVALERRVGQRTTAELAYQRSSRTTNDPTAAGIEYEENGIILQFRHEFGRSLPRDEPEP